MALGMSAAIIVGYIIIFSFVGSSIYLLIHVNRNAGRIIYRKELYFFAIIMYALLSVTVGALYGIFTQYAHTDCRLVERYIYDNATGLQAGVIHERECDLSPNPLAPIAFFFSLLPAASAVFSVLIIEYHSLRRAFVVR